MIIAFSRALAWEKVADRPDEGPLLQCFRRKAVDG